MAGAILTQTERELAAMSDASPMALKAARGRLKEAQALNADLRAAVSALTKENGDLTRARDAAQEQIKRLLDLQERTQAQRDAAQAELNMALAVVNAARAYWAMESTDNRERLGSALGDYAVAKYNAARGAK